LTGINDTGTFFPRS